MMRIYLTQIQHHLLHKMNLGSKVRTLDKSGLLCAGRIANKVRNLNFEQSAFDLEDTGSGINIAVRDRSPKMFDAVAVRPAPLTKDSDWHTLQFGLAATPYKCDTETFEHDRTALSDKILVNRWGKYYVNFRFATLFFITGSINFKETVFFNYTSYDNTTLKNLYWKGAVTYQYPEKHTISGTDYPHLTIAEKDWYQMGTVTAIIEPTDLYKDADGKYNLSVSYMIPIADDNIMTIEPTMTNISIVHYPI